jgi:demethylmenaquinone methyltransferase/2-methoxy-6-polyprenyl-1,4-benzoquinol methylase
MAQLSGSERQRYVAKLFARISKHYDVMNTIMTFGMHHQWKRITAKLTTEGLSGLALDIATGTGDISLQLAKNEDITYSIGIDLIPEMINLASDKSRKTAVNHKTTFLVGDALNLPFPNSTFACATAGFSLRNMPDLRQALTEMVRVVEPNGRVTTLELTPMNNSLQSKLFRIYFHKVVPIIGQLIARDKSAYKYLPESVDYFIECDKLSELMTSVGLVEVGYRKVGFGTVAIHYGIKP